MEGMLADAASAGRLRFTIVRMPDFYGPFVVNGFTEVMLQRALEGASLIWPGNLDIPYECIFIDDAGEAMVTAGLSDRSDGRSFNVPGAAVTTPRAFLEEIVRQAGTRSAVRSLNSPLLVGAAGLFSPMIREYREMMYLKREQFLLDGSRYVSAFGKVPATPYADGIARALLWFKSFSLPTT
jgi:nucleoside-diphosphate-sugar epimerase